MTDTTLTPESVDALAPGTWAVEPAHSEIGFSVRHLGLSKVRGRFNGFSGQLEIGESASETSVEATVDLSTVDTNNSDRDKHLTSTDFFDVEANPQMVFHSTSVTEETLAGNLTINGVTKPVEFALELHGVAVDGYGTIRAGFSASGQIRRSDFGIDFNAPLGVDGVLISDKVDIELEIQAVPA